jgi:hypothetical protein
MNLRDALIELAEGRILAQARRPPFSRFGVQLAQQKTAAGTAFLRWRSLDHARMGVALWEEMLNHPATPVSLIDDLYAMEAQRIVLNMQISLLHTLARQAEACAHKMERAETACLRRRAAS